MNDPMIQNASQILFIAVLIVLGVLKGKKKSVVKIEKA